MLDWSTIDCVFLDMDGTLLDLHFDNHFWLEHMPRRYAEQRGLDLENGRRELYARYKQVEGSLNWYCMDYWSDTLGLDVEQLKHEVADRISVLPYVREFLTSLRGEGKRVLLVTNAHGKGLAMKMRRTQLDQHFHRLVCSHDLGQPKEGPGFWAALQQLEAYDPARTLLVDDSLPVLRTARAYGIAHLVAVARPDSRQPPRSIEEFPSMQSFLELMPDRL